MQVAYIDVWWLLLTGSMLWMLIVHLKKNKLATYRGTITIPTRIKLFSINIKISQKSFLTILKVLKICLTFLFFDCLSKRLAVQCVYLWIAKLLGIYFSHLTCKNFLNFFKIIIYESEKNEKKKNIGQEDAKTVKVLLLLQSFIPRGEKRKIQKCIKICMIVLPYTLLSDLTLINWRDGMLLKFWTNLEGQIVVESV